MNREALLLYLHDVRDLEVAKHKLLALNEQAERAYQAKKEELDRAAAHKVLEGAEEYEAGEMAEDMSASMRLGCGTFLVAVVILVVAVVSLAIAFDASIIVGLGFFVPFAGMFFGIYSYFTNPSHNPLAARRDRYREYERARKEVEEYNRGVDAGEAERKRELEQALVQSSGVQLANLEEVKKVDAILARYYALNVLPAVYHELVPVCYIYDYMSTSQASLEDALIHEHLENGFQRLEAKLDQVIAAVETQIYETRCLRAESRAYARAQAARDRQMLASLQRTERDAAEAARYAELAECNAAACAYFELAAYLKD